MPLTAATRLGPYEIIGPLGAGGMGEVYRARDTRLEREVAIKVLPASARPHPEARERFRREALALSRLNHPNIEMVLDLGEDAGVDFLVLELVPGESLAARVARGRVPEREAAEIGAQVAEALAEAHERGVMHRDLKPGNIMLTPKGRAKVLDFGLAKFHATATDETQTMGLTQVGTTTGTPAYMAPEQLLGEPIDPRADLYSLGVVLYELTTGQRPFRAAMMTALSNEILHGRLAAPRTIEPGLSARADAVILHAMERERARRYQTASEMAGELRRLAATDPWDSGESATAPASPARQVTSIAVLPLENLSGDPAQEYFSDGMTEELISCLAQVRALRIVSRTSVMRYKGQHRPIPEIARELNVDAVVEGSVRLARDRVRITAQLIDAASERHLWAKSYERDVAEILALQGEVAAAICAEIEVSVTPQEETRLREARPVNPAAYQAYLKGRHLIERRTEETLHLGLASFEDAARLDPTFELAHVGIADAYNLLAFYATLPATVAFPRAEAAARRALEINPGSAEAMTSLAYGVTWFDRNLPEAERLFRKAIDLHPRYSLSHLWFSNILLLAGRMEEARAEVQLARSAAPMSPGPIAFEGWFPYYGGKFDEALRIFDDAVALVPDFGAVYYWMGLALMGAGRNGEAVTSFERGIALLGRTPMVVSGLACAHALDGRTERARELLAEMAAQRDQRYVSAYYLAHVHATFGDRAEALAALELAAEERMHMLGLIRMDPLLESLRGDPRFEAIAARVARPEAVTL
jgi:serine/threonine protein kinase/tetratricopeptide (TPR) repeat protein